MGVKDRHSESYLVKMTVKGDKSREGKRVLDETVKYMLANHYCNNNKSCYLPAVDRSKEEISDYISRLDFAPETYEEVYWSDYINPDTFRHSVGVAILTHPFAKELIGTGKIKVSLSDAVKAAILHDCYKDRIDPGILNKPDKLSGLERRIIDGHPAGGANIIRQHNKLLTKIYGKNNGYTFSEQIINGVRDHQKWIEYSNKYSYPDSKGRPTKMGQLIAIPDAADAMLRGRTYRHHFPDGMPQCIVIKEFVNAIEKGRRHFNPEFANAFINSILKEGAKQELNALKSAHQNEIIVMDGSNRYPLPENVQQYILN